MKEKFEKTKKFVSDNREIITLAILAEACTAIGYIGGQWSVLKRANDLIKCQIAFGVYAGIEYVRANGLEAADELLKNAYKIK